MSPTHPSIPDLEKMEGAVLWRRQGLTGPTLNLWTRTSAHLKINKWHMRVIIIGIALGSNTSIANVLFIRKHFALSQRSSQVIFKPHRVKYALICKKCKKDISTLQSFSLDYNINTLLARRFQSESYWIVDFLVFGYLYLTYKLNSFGGEWRQWGFFIQFTCQYSEMSHYPQLFFIPIHFSLFSPLQASLK